MDKGADKTEISAIVCTYNRASYLRDAVESLFSQSLDEDAFEVIVVDNASTDDTKKICDRFLKGHKNFRYVYEPNKGLSNARNAGIERAKGRFVAFTDDDARADRDWLKCLVNAFNAANPPPASVGGRIFLEWEDKKPGWFPDELLGYLGRLDYGGAPFFLGPDKTLFGGNIAFKTDIIKEVNGFDAGLGRTPDGLLSNEEIKVFKILRQKNYPLYYAPDAVVYHRVPAQRATEEFLYRRSLWQGVSDLVMLKEEKGFFSICAGLLLSLLKFAAISGVAAFARLATDKKKIVFLTAMINYHLGFSIKGAGYILGLYKGRQG
ncbi:MAG: glycosyltransferase family 2 protein [Deltaproteobacteria bacterium]